MICEEPPKPGGRCERRVRTSFARARADTGPHQKGDTLTRQAAYLGALGVALALIAAAAAARADTTGQKWQTRVVVAKSGAHCADGPELLQPLPP